MLLKVGELAKRTGLTVRTLHHYDAIGLLTPSARSASGYRLYSREDVLRLHAIQALRQLGLSLASIAEMLSEEEVSLQAIVARQIRSLDHEIARARELRGRLDVLQAAIAADEAPKMDDWLATLELMATYREYFTAAELRKIFRSWRRTRDDWAPLLAEVRDAQSQALPPDSLEVQRLAHRWMDLSMRWMQGDLELAKRWGQMHEQEPTTSGHNGIDTSMIEFMREAIELRMAALHRHLTPEDVQRLDKGLGREWNALVERAQRLLMAQADPGSEEAQALAAEWDGLVDRTVDHDPGLRARFERAYRSEPLLQMGHVVDPEVRDFIARARALST